MSARVGLMPAFVLHRRPFRDTSAMVELWTESTGRISVVARGIQRPRSPLRSLLQPFRPLLVSWVGRGEMPTLTAAEADGVPLPLAGERLLSGLYLNELLLKLLARGDAHPALFHAYRQTIVALLNTAAADVAMEQRILRLFEKCLLTELGYGLLLDRDGRTGRVIDPQQVYRYDFDAGPVPIPATTTASDEHQISGASLLALAQDQLATAEHLRQAKYLLRQAIDHHLGQQQINSRELRHAFETQRRNAAHLEAK